HRPRAVRRRGRRLLRPPDPRHAPLRWDRPPAGGDGRRRLPHPRAARPAGAVSEFADRADAERWFGRHGLPYFVPETRHAVHAALRPARLVWVALGAAVLGAAVGGAVALASRVSWGVPSALTTAGAVAALDRK